MGLFSDRFKCQRRKTPFGTQAWRGAVDIASASGSGDQGSNPARVKGFLGEIIALLW
jgi:hypothetical protein